MEGIGGSGSHEYHDSRLSPFFSHRSSIVSTSAQGGSHFFGERPKGSSFRAWLAGQGLHQGDKGPRTSLLLQDVYCSQEGGKGQAHHRPFQIEQDASCSSFQDGASGEDCVRGRRGYVGGIRRHPGCLPACSYSLGFPQVFRLHPGRKDLCLPGSSLWPVSSTLDVLQSHEARQAPSSVSGGQGLVFPGRLLGSSTVLSSLQIPCRDAYQASLKSWLHHQLGEICSGTQSKAGVPGDYAGSGEVSVFIASGKDSEDAGTEEVASGETPGFSKSSGEMCGFHELLCGVPSPGQVVFASNHSLDECEDFRFSQGPSSPSGSGPEGSFGCMGVSTVPECSSSYESPSAFIGDNDRCLSPRLERGSPSSESPRCVGSGGEGPFNELEGAKGDSPVDPSFSGFSEESVSKSLERFHHRSGLLAKAGFSEVRGSLGSDQGDFGPLQSAGDCPFSSPSEGDPQCPGRQGVQGNSDFHRVVPGQVLLQPRLQDMGSPSGGSLCNQGQRLASQVRIPLSGSSGSGDGCVFPGLEQVEVNLPVSPDALSSSGAETAGGFPGFGVPDCSPLGGGGLVSLPSGAMPRQDASSPGLHPVSVHLRRPGVLSGGGRLSPSRVEALGSSFLARGFSPEVVRVMLSEHKPSTLRQYQSTWTMFLGWLDLTKIPHDSIDRVHVYAFLEWKLRQSQYKTVATHRCALKLPLSEIFGIQLDSKESESFMRGAYNLKPPRRRAPLPEWSLSFLLGFLNESPFEPLVHADRKSLLQKVSVLLLLASGRRISDIAALSRQWVFRDQRYSLVWLSGFRAKTDGLRFRPEFPSIAELASVSEEDLLLCPVRAWRILLERRGRDILGGGSDCLWPVPKSALTALICQLLSAAGRAAGRPGGAPGGPHQFRKLAASYSEMYFDTLPDWDKLLPARMGSLNMSVLRKNYLGSVPPLRVPCVVPLGTVLVD